MTAITEAKGSFQSATGSANYLSSSRLSKTMAWIKRKPIGAIGALLIISFMMIAFFAPVLAPHDKYRMDASKILLAPNADNLLGTDEFGRDILSRLIWGAQISLYVGVLAVGIGTTTGALLGLVGGFSGGKVDMVIQRGMDGLLAFPSLVLALALVAALGSNINNVVLALGIVVMPSASRVIRSNVLVVRETTYIEAARSVGVSTLRLIFRHVLPNCLAPYIVLVTAAIGTAILSEASLSFLGLGTPPPEPSWGAMLSGSSQRYMYRAPWIAIFPGLAISLAVFGFNFLGDALRDTWDPKMRNR